MDITIEANFEYFHIPSPGPFEQKPAGSRVLLFFFPMNISMLVKISEMREGSVAP